MKKGAIFFAIALLSGAASATGHIAHKKPKQAVRHAESGKQQPVQQPGCTLESATFFDKNGNPSPMSGYGISTGRLTASVASAIDIANAIISEADERKSLPAKERLTGAISGTGGRIVLKHKCMTQVSDGFHVIPSSLNAFPTIPHTDGACSNGKVAIARVREVTIDTEGNEHIATLYSYEGDIPANDVLDGLSEPERNASIRFLSAVKEGRRLSDADLTGFRKDVPNMKFAVSQSCRIVTDTEKSVDLSTDK